jgi:hypothetical protein
MLGTFPYKGREHVRGTTLGLVVVTVLFFVFALALLGGAVTPRTKGLATPLAQLRNRPKPPGNPKKQLSKTWW